MSEPTSESSPEVLDYRGPAAASPKAFRWPQGAEWFWWGLLLASLMVGFGMTIFAPT
jgi:hypothetical protein